MACVASAAIPLVGFVWVAKQNEPIDPDWFSSETVDLLLVVQGRLRVEFADEERRSEEPDRVKRVRPEAAIMLAWAGRDIVRVVIAGASYAGLEAMLARRATWARWRP